MLDHSQIHFQNLQKKKKNSIMKICDGIVRIRRVWLSMIELTRILTAEGKD